MNGRSIITEIPCPSICAFCAHRLGARRPSHIQRRFLQTSRPARIPPAAGAALREDDSEAQPQVATKPSWATSSPSGSPSWAKPVAGQPNWARPSFANSLDSTAKSPVFASNGFDTEDELMPHEKRAREAMLNRQAADKAAERAEVDRKAAVMEAARKEREQRQSVEQQSINQNLRKPISRTTSGTSRFSFSNTNPREKVASFDVMNELFPEDSKRGTTKVTKNDSISERGDTSSHQKAQPRGLLQRGIGAEGRIRLQMSGSEQLNSRNTTSATAPLQRIVNTIKDSTFQSSPKSEVPSNEGGVAMQSAPPLNTSWRPAFATSATPNDAEASLLPHEQRARESVLRQQATTVRLREDEKERKFREREMKRDQWQPRNIQISRGAGPESSRAGRFEPRIVRTIDERNEWARSAVGRRNAQESHQRKGIRYSYGHVISDLEAPSPTKSDLNWSNLRTRQQEKSSQADHAQVPNSIAPETSFLQGRADREAKASMKAYVPLGGSSIARTETEELKSPPREGRNQAISVAESSPRVVSTTINEVNMHDQSSSFRSLYDGISRAQSPLDDRFRSQQISSPRFTRRGIEAQAQTVAGYEIPTKEPSTEIKHSLNPDDNTARGGRRRERPERSARTEQNERPERAAKSRRAESNSVKTMPKGKDRDKAKRREQFLEDGEDADADGSRAAAAARAEERKRRREERAAKKAAAPTPILLPEYISVANLAYALKTKVEHFVEKLQQLGFENTGLDHILNSEDAGLIAMEYNYEAIIDRGDTEDLKAREPAQDPTTLPQRPPVVTIMGHVDHGKTTLLDYLRKSSVAATEHGGITQHIGAFSVPMPGGKVITFLDTPGHAAFLSMRQRGANVTDIVILVVAADDSVKPQTIEAINHAKAANVPIIVAINKIDKEDTNVDRVKQDLARNGVDVEDFGGDVQAICVSGKTGEGMEELEEAAVTLAEIIDMRAEVDGPAEGWILEASIKSVGKVATVLVRRGTMRPGDLIVAGQTWARIRTLRNEAGVEIESAGPGTPVEIDGWRDQPIAGDEVLQAPDENKAKSVVEYRLTAAERERLAVDMEAINEFRTIAKGKRERDREEAIRLTEAAASDPEAVPDKIVEEEKVSGTKYVYFVVKGDVSGSVEAVVDQISALGNQEVQPRILRSGVGQISEFDIDHAAAAKGHVISFNTVVEPAMKRLAEAAKVGILDQNIIYRLVDDVKDELSKHLKPLLTQRVLGEAEIAQIFDINVKGRKTQAMAGCKVRNGLISKTARIRVLRNGEKIFDGMLASLKNVKKDVAEMKKGSECGIGFEKWEGFEVGDLVQAYDEKEEKRYL